MEEAVEIVRLATLAPEAPARVILGIARAYLLWSWTGEPDGDLDALMAFTPWRDDGRRYSDAFRAGSVRTLLRLVDGSEDLIEQALDDRLVVEPARFSARGAR